MVHPVVNEPEINPAKELKETKEIHLPTSSLDEPATKRIAMQVEETILKVKLLHPDAHVPKRGSEKAAGYDLYGIEKITIPAKSSSVVSTGVAVAVPEGHYGRVAPRSGLAFKHGIDVGAGVVDSDYRGEIKILLFNLSNEDYTIEKGDRVAQLILEKISILESEVVDDLDETERGVKGFASTGK